MLLVVGSMMPSRHCPDVKLKDKGTLACGLPQTYEFDAI